MLLQAAFRGWRARRDYKNLQAATRYIQAHAKGWITRRQVRMQALAHCEDRPCAAAELLLAAMNLACIRSCMPWALEPRMHAQVAKTKQRLALEERFNKIMDRHRERIYVSRSSPQLLGMREGRER